MLAIEVGGFAGRQIVGQHDHRRGEARKLLPPAAQQISQHTFFDVDDVAGAFRQTAAGQALEHFGVAAQGAADGVFRREMPIANHLLQFGAQLRIVENLQMRVEDGGVLLAQFLGDRLAIVLHFGAGGLNGLIQPLHLVVDRVARDEAPRDTESFGAHHQGFADGDAG